MNKLGQSLIEYALIVVLVILGIVIMGPYVLRSVNAHFKLWNDGVQDSFTEDLNQSAVVPNMVGYCSCNPQPGGCGSPGGGVGSCGVGYREWDYNCNPVGCNGAAGDSYCVSDESCCTYVPQGCGTFPCPAGGCAGAPTAPPSPDNCYYGQNIMVNDCASNPVECQTNPICPLPACLGIIAVTGAQACPNGPPGNGAILLENNYVSFVPDLTSCNPAVPCQYSCPNGYIFQDGICINACVWGVRVQVAGTAWACMGGNCAAGYNGVPDTAPGHNNGYDNAAYICTKYGYKYLLGWDVGFSKDGCSNSCAYRWYHIIPNPPFVEGSSYAGVDLSTITWHNGGDTAGNCNGCNNLEYAVCASAPNATIPLGLNPRVVVANANDCG